MPRTMFRACDTFLINHSWSYDAMVKSLNANSILTEKMQGLHWHNKGLYNGYAIKTAVLFRLKSGIRWH